VQHTNYSFPDILS